MHQGQIQLLGGLQWRHLIKSMGGIVIKTNVLHLLCRWQTGEKTLLPTGQLPQNIPCIDLASANLINQKLPPPLEIAAAKLAQPTMLSKFLPMHLGLMISKPGAAPCGPAPTVAIN